MSAGPRSSAIRSISLSPAASKIDTQAALAVSDHSAKWTPSGVSVAPNRSGGVLTGASLQRGGRARDQPSCDDIRPASAGVPLDIGNRFGCGDQVGERLGGLAAEI